MLLIKLGPLTGQEKTLFLGTGVGPDGQMPTICFPLQIRLDEIKAAAGEPRRIRRILEVDVILIQPIRDRPISRKYRGKFNLRKYKENYEPRMEDVAARNPPAISHRVR